MKINSAFYTPAPELAHGTDAIADVIAIGREATVFRPIQRALRSTGWAVVHADHPDIAIRYLRSNVAAVAVIEADEGWRDVLARINMIPDAPQTVLLTSSDDLNADEVVRMGGHDVVRRPMNDADLLWTVASAWHHWMKQREGERYSGA